jgi:VWFA-related protein
VRRSPLFGVALLLVPATFLAQEAEPPTFPAGTEAVLLDMVVRDEDGQLVDDLRADEVQVFEDGRACPITSFRLVRPEDRARAGPAASGPGATPPAPAGPPPGPPRGSSQGLQPPPEGARSTSVEDESLLQEAGPRQGRGEPMGSVVLLVFDRLGIDAAMRARAAALAMIARPFPDDTWFAVLKTGREFSVLQQFTEDRSALAGPIERATVGAEGGKTDSQGSGGEGAAEEALALALEADAAAARGAGPGALALAQASARLAEFEARMDALQRGDATLYPLVAVARALRTVRGRKTMLYFGAGLEVPPELFEVFQSAIGEANRSNLSIYGFDARGLEVYGYAASSASVFAGSASPWNLTRGALVKGDDPIAPLVANPQLNLRNLSEGTGGVLVANTNDLRPGLERVTADLRSYYEIAYAAPNPVADGTWREIDVKVSRPRVRVRARKGYFALPPGAPVVRPSELPLVVALDGDQLPREVPLQAGAVHLAGEGEERDVLVALKVPLSAATFESTEGEGGEQVESARLSLLARVLDADGGLVARMSHDTPLEGTDTEVEAMRTRSLVVKRPLRLAPGRYTLEAAVLDRASSTVGARRVPFEVPDQAGLTLGSLTVVRPEPLPEGADDLLRFGDIRGMPRLGEAVEAREGEVVGVFLTLRPGDGPARPRLTLEVSRDGQVVSRSEPELPPPEAAGRIAYLGQLPAREFSAGRYVVHATARQGSEEVTTATSFRVVEAVTAAPPELPPAPDVPVDVAPVLEAAGRYLVEFQERFRNIVAEETYRQWADSDRQIRKMRTLRSDIVFVTVPGDVPWITFRDVYEVDGQEVRDREARLETLFSNPDASTLDRANAILHESARFNLGPTYRTVNAPTLALVMLLPQHQGRFRWKRKGTRRYSGREGVELRAVEVGRPTLVHQLDGQDVPATARFWIEPGSGRALRTEAHYEVPRGEGAVFDAECWINTQYRPEPALAVWVPDNMYERCAIEARARYSNYRRFQVETAEEGARVAEDAP